jgi:hypothetical protein
MAKKYCPLKTAMSLFDNDSEKLIDFTMNCRSLSIRLTEFFNREFTFEKFVNVIAEITRVNENLRTAYENWEEDNFNISPNHIQFLGSNRDYSVFHFGYIKEHRYYVEFSVKDEGNAHYVVSRVYNSNDKDDFAMAYSMTDIYNQLQDAMNKYIQNEREKAVDNFITEHECDCEEDCECDCECEEDCDCSCHESTSDSVEEK